MKERLKERERERERERDEKKKEKSAVFLQRCILVVREMKINPKLIFSFQ